MLTATLLALAVAVALRQRAQDAQNGCTDNAPECHQWAAAGECDNNPTYMLAECAKACGCRSPPSSAAAGDGIACVDRDKTGACGTWAESGE